MPNTTATTTTATSTPVKAKAKPEETSIKLKLSSVSNGCFWAALKQYLNTWQPKSTSTKNSSSKKRKSVKPPTDDLKSQQQQQQEDCQCHCQQRGKWFKRKTCKEYCSDNSSCSSINSSSSFSSCSSTSSASSSKSLPQLITVYWKTKIRQLVTTTFNTSANTVPTSPRIGVDRKQSRCRRYGRRVEIVAKLLSLNLIGHNDSIPSTFTPFEVPSSQRRNSADSGYLSIHSIESIVSNTASSDYQRESNSSDTTASSPSTSLSLSDDDKMTITDLTFLEIRDEHPDLDSEIRSILTTHAVSGATISQIRDDYRKLTGLRFPVYECVTDFLLSIPHVTAYCTEQGTRIFNIQPMDKTKHIHDMVVNQKPPQEPVPRSYKVNQRNYYRERQRNQNYFPNNWRLNQSFRRRNQQEILTQEQQQQQHHLPQQQPIMSGNQYIVEREQIQEIPLNAVVSNENNMSRVDSEGFHENNDNWYYNDNCNYLHNRICNQPNIVETNSQNILALAQAMAPLDTQYTAIDPLQHQLISEMAQLPSQEAFDNFNINMNAMPGYDNNTHHLNTRYHQGNLNSVGPRTRRSVNNSHKGAMPLASRSSSPTSKSCYTNDSMYTSDYEAHLLDFLLLGDDFFLHMARMELRCKFKKYQKVLQSGFCVSGQTINGAIKRISSSSESGRSVIVNIGSVNIMQCRQLIQIEHEYRELITTMLKKGFKPILTTLAPVANYTHNNEVKEMLERFNEFVKREGERKQLMVIDIWKCLVNEKGHVLFDCYQDQPRKVTGANESYLFWNKIGRQRVLQLIESHLEY